MRNHERAWERHEEKRPHGRPRNAREDEITMDLKDIEHK
jgi:hypothetical protein